jgi:hypothetical protein
VRTSALALTGCLVTLTTTRALAQGEPQSPALPADAHIDIAPQPPEARTRQAAAGVAGPETTSLDEAPPPRQRHKGIVLESTLGVLGFAGSFRHLAPPAYWMHAQLGYELLSWFMLFGEGELAFTDTSESQDPSGSRAFPVWGIGGGARASVHFSERVAAFVQAEVGALTASVPHDALAYLGFRGAESLGAQFGGRVGVEWYQKDRHLALCAQGGPRIAQGFSKSLDSTLPLMWDAAVGLRYTF